MHRSKIAKTFVITVILMTGLLGAQSTAIWGERKKALGELLLARSIATEGPEVFQCGPSNWSSVANAADTLRGRVLFLSASPGLDASNQAAVLAQCKALAEKILSLEAATPAMQGSPVLAKKDQRGWGIETVYNLRGVEYKNTVDLWSTSDVLAALTDYLPWARRDPGLYARVLRTCEEVMAWWIAHARVVHPTQGAFFLKVASDDEHIRNFIIFNTESLMAIALQNLARAKGADGDAKAAGAWFEEARKHAWQVKRGVCDRILTNGVLNPKGWSYMVESNQTIPTFSRSEDVQHGGVTCEVVWRFQREGVPFEGKPMYRKEDVKAVADILDQHAFLLKSPGVPAYTVWVDPKHIKPGKPVFTDFVMEDPKITNWLKGTAWRYYVGETPQRAHLGHPLRTGWGWVYCASVDPTILEKVYRYYAAYLDTDLIGPKTLKPVDVTRGGKGLYISLAALYTVMAEGG